jgi:hypothetical protein
MFLTIKGHTGAFMNANLHLVALYLISEKVSSSVLRMLLT